MQESLTPRVRPGTTLAWQAPTAGLAGQLVLLISLWATVGLGPVAWATGIAYAVSTWALLTSAVHRSPLRTFGPADYVTLTRAVLTGGVTALVVDNLGTQPPVALLITITSVALFLDFVDGKVARYTGTVSKMGARFDMEVDAFLVLVLSIHVAMSLGPWVLAIGAMRYLFVAASWAAPWLRADLPPSFARKTVAAVQGIILTAAASTVLPHAATTILIALSLTTLLWSFGRDTIWLWRTTHRPTDSTPAAVATPHR